MAQRLRGTGRVFPRGARWWIAYYVNGVEHRESAGRTEPEAVRRLKARLREIHGGQFVGPQLERVTVDELLDAYVNHCLVQGAHVVRTVDVDGRPVRKGTLVSTLAHIREAFGGDRAIAVTAARIEAWVAEMMAAGVASGTVRARVAYLRAALRLAHRHGRLAEVPYMPTVQVDNTREGFIEPDECAKLVGALPDPFNDAARFAYLVGWRKAEVFGLTWAMIDRTGQQIRLITNKARQPRAIPMTLEVGGLIEKRYRLRALTPWVFHLKGRRVSAQQATQRWNRACRALGFWREDLGRPTKLFHDFRRTAYRNMIDAGVDPFTAMDIVGHTTTSMAKRYAIRSTKAMAKALADTQHYLARHGQ